MIDLIKCQMFFCGGKYILRLDKGVININPGMFYFVSVIASVGRGLIVVEEYSPPPAVSYR